MYPRLIIRPSVYLTLESLREDGCLVYSVTSDTLPDDLTQIRTYSGSRVVAVGDLATNPRVANRLLKVLEAATCKVICLSSVDIFDATFLSRFTVVEKVVESVVNSSPQAVSVEDILSEDQIDWRVVASRSPAYLPVVLAYSMSRLPAKRKLFT